jgi:hypothetical protein
MTATGPAPADALRPLLVAARLWARRATIDTVAIRTALDEAIVAVHGHYVGAIPLYRRWAANGGVEDARDAAVIAAEMLLSSDVFKGYDPDWVADGDFGALTRWLATVFVRLPDPVLDGVSDIESWRAALRADGVFVWLSSGTAGRPSFVPRDAATVAALRSNGMLYSAMLDGEAAMPPSFDCLALTPAATRSGLQAAGVGIAARAERAHHLDSQDDAGWETALAFVREAVWRHRPLVVFAPPPLADELCARAREARIGALPPGSLVATGGGWKGARALAPKELRERVERSLGVPGARIVDSYGAAELNCVLIRCPQGRYHVPPLLRVVVVDSLLAPIDPQPGAHGLLGFLDPFALSYPGFVLPGDTGRLLEGRCACGLVGQAIAGPIERATDEAPRGCATTGSAET